MDDDVKYTIFMLPIYTLWKLGPVIHNEHTPPPYTIGLEKIGQSGKTQHENPEFGHTQGEI